MKTIICAQGSDEWRKARLGLPTASCFDQIVTPAKLEPSGSQDKYLAQLAAEWFLGVPLDDFQSGFMERGTELEPVAAKWYEFERDVTLTAVGFCTTDDGLAGCSPDRLVGEDGMAEIKVPAAVTHMEYLIGNGAALVKKYWLQVQGELWVTGRQWCDLLSYHDTIPNVVVRVLPDEKTQAALSREVPKFCARLQAAKDRLTKDRPEPAAVVPTKQAAMSRALYADPVIISAGVAVLGEDHEF